MVRSKKSYSKKRLNAAFWLVMAALTFALAITVTGVVFAAGSASGLVFRDYNANGTREATEPGVANVTITAYGNANTAVGSAFSDAAGNYTITWTGPDTRVRLEFSGLSAFEQQGAFGSASGTSVQFADDTATNVNYGINRPSDYCLASPNLQLITTCFQLGDQSSGEHAVVSHSYSGTGALTDLASDIDVGAVWGLAYKRPAGGAAGTVFTSAFAKRQAGYGPGGPGQIYAITGGVVTQFALIPNAGGTGHTAPYAQDALFYDSPGKESLGDLDISEDGSTLYVINLNDRQLYSVNSTTAAVQALGVIGAPACTGGVYRPFGLGIRDGLVYVGGVCTNENSVLGTTAGLQAYVFSYNPVGPVITQVLTFPLNYPRGCADIFAGVGGYEVDGAPLACRTGEQGSLADWQPWSANWPQPNLGLLNGGSGTGLSGDVTIAAQQKFFAYAQPMLAGIEFVNDDMVVSFRDRMGDQVGYEDNGPDGLGNALGFPDTLVTVTAGDILRASQNVPGVWTLENAAGSNPPGTFGPTVLGVGNEQGPGNGEFYVGDNFGAAHDETITGGIVQVPGAPEIAAASMDPGTAFTAGTIWYNNTSGANSLQYRIVPELPNLPPAPFGKGNGLGDLTALCAAAPLEIGNYVWFDTDQDGIQDPNEQPLAGIVLTLTDTLGNAILSGGTPVTATTDSQGRYIFSSDAASNHSVTPNFVYGVPLAENTSYQVRINNTQPALVTFTPTLLNAGAVNGRDSNGDITITPNFSIAPVTTGTAGQNNHTFDFGYFVGPANTPTPPVTSTPGAGGTPSPIRLDPAIVKLVDPAFALPGEDVRWTIIVTNPHNVAINNVTFVDNFPSQLEIISASADNSVGSLVVTGNTVTYSIVVINPGQSVRVSVLTRIRPGTPVPFVITNTVNLTNGLSGSSTSIIGSASATILSVGSLPATGFEPAWRKPLLAGIGVLVLAVSLSIGAWYIQRRPNTG